MFSQPSLKLFSQFMQTVDNFFLEHIHKFVPTWKEMSSEDIKIMKTIGITNKTYIIESIGQPQKIVFRHYGETGDGLFLNRDQEVRICKTLANLHLGPQFYGYTNQIRIEKYIDNQILQQEHMKDAESIKMVANNLAKLHAVKMEIDHTPLFEKHFSTDSEMLRQAREKCTSALFNPEERQLLQKIQEMFSEKEVSFLRKHIPKDDLVFSHNDLLANNILLIPPEFDHVVFIDFEYSSYNFRGFDIANYFIESQFNYMNPNPPYFFIEEGIVDEELLKIFVDAYLTACKAKVCRENLMKQIRIGLMFSHYFWTAWALIMAKQNDIEFDYLSFIEVRYHKYYQLKRHFYPLG